MVNIRERRALRRAKNTMGAGYAGLHPDDIIELLVLAEKELKARIILVGEMGSRVRATVLDREAGELVVQEHAENKVRIKELKTKIRELKVHR